MPILIKTSAQVRLDFYRCNNTNTPNSFERSFDKRIDVNLLELGCITRHTNTDTVTVYLFLSTSYKKNIVRILG